ncbi:unnamed protein product [Trichobilharzia regenti]|nr:unnamed protein product [Trichobilharzia regenti]
MTCRRGTLLNHAVSLTFKGGALSNINSFESKAFNENTTGLTVRAHKIRSTNSELQEMLRSITTSENTMPKTIRAMKSLNTEKHRKELPSEDEATRQTKLERLHCSLKAIHGLTGVYDEKLFPKAYSTHVSL